MLNMVFIKIRSMLTDFFRSYLMILIIALLGVLTYWQTLDLNKKDQTIQQTNLSQAHIPLYQLENTYFRQYKQAVNQKDQPFRQLNQYQIYAKNALQYADDKNFELIQAKFEKSFFKELQKQSNLYVSSEKAELDSNFNQLQLNQNIFLKRQDLQNQLTINADQAILELRNDIISFAKINAQYQNLNTGARHRFTAGQAKWDEQKQRLEASSIQIYFENPQKP
jgi:LPS export ABC transporter protein LptC